MATAPIAVPKTYAEWVTVLDMLKAKTDDEAVLDAMQKGTIEWQDGVAERFAQRLIDVISFRLNAASDKFQRDLSHCGGQERALIQALLALRKELRFLSEAINLPALPENTRKQYYQLVIDQANDMQSALEDSSKRDRSGKMASLIRNHKVNAF